MSTIPDARSAAGTTSRPLPGSSSPFTTDPIAPPRRAARTWRPGIEGGLAIAAWALAALVVAAPARATPDFDEGFEETAIGELNGQAGWTCTPGTVAVALGGGVDSTHVAHGSLGQSIGEAERFLPTAFHYTAADTAILWSCWANVGPNGCNKNAIAGPSGHITRDGVVFGVNVAGGNLPTTYLSCVGTQTGDPLSFGHWYEVRVVVNFSVAGGQATLQYRDLTLGQSAFTTDATLRNVSLGQSTDVDGTYPFQQAYVRVDDQCAGVCFVDNLHIGAPGSSVAAVKPNAAAARWTLGVGPDPARVAGSAAVEFSLPVRSHVRIAAFDTNGRRVCTLADEDMGSGAHERRWDLRRDGGEPLGAGLYFVRLEAGGHVVCSKLAIVR